MRRIRTALASPPVFQGFVGQPRDDGPIEPAAVVMTVSRLDELPGVWNVPAATVTDGGLKLQVAPEGRVADTHDKLTVPAKPSTEVTVTVAMPAAPGLDTLIRPDAE